MKKGDRNLHEVWLKRYCKSFIWGISWHAAYFVSVVDLIKTPDYPLYQASCLASIISLGYLLRYLGHRRYCEECEEPDIHISCSMGHHYSFKGMNSRNTINYGMLLLNLRKWGLRLMITCHSRKQCVSLIVHELISVNHVVKSQNIVRACTTQI